MLQGHQSWAFDNKPLLVSAASVVGPAEGKGPLANDFDLIHGDRLLEEKSWEKAEKKMLEEAAELAIKKAGVTKEQIQFFIAGDLMNQIVSSSFASRTLAIPYIGIFGACSTSMEGLALAAQLVDSGFAKYALAGTCSHNSSAEKQYRYPTEYGAQKPPTAQFTVTGAGAAVVADRQEVLAAIRRGELPDLLQRGAAADLVQKSPRLDVVPTGEDAAKNGETEKKLLGLMPVVTRATIGKIVDMGIKDPFNMGAAMAPAAVDTIAAHMRDFDLTPGYYDLIVTGDLAQIGYDIAKDLMAKHGISLSGTEYNDCGLMIYDREKQAVQAGGSGCACSAVVTYGHLLKRLIKGELKRILVVATGSLLSPVTYQQGESIPCIAHAVAIERPEEG